jgi:hypothetical protein
MHEQSTICRVKILSKEGEWVLQNEQIHVHMQMRREIEMYYCKARGGRCVFLKISTRWRWSDHLFVEHPTPMVLPNVKHWQFFKKILPLIPSGTICQVPQEKLEKEAGCFKKWNAQRQRVSRFLKCPAFCGGNNSTYNP